MTEPISIVAADAIRTGYVKAGSYCALTVNLGVPVLVVTPLSLAFYATQGSTTAIQKYFFIFDGTSNAYGSLNWSAVQHVPAISAALTLDATSGTVPTDSPGFSEVTVTFDPTGVAVGNYDSCKVTVSATGNDDVVVTTPVVVAPVYTSNVPGRVTSIKQSTGDVYQTDVTFEYQGDPFNRWIANSYAAGSGAKPSISTSTLVISDYAGLVDTSYGTVSGVVSLTAGTGYPVLSQTLIGRVLIGAGPDYYDVYVQLL